MADAYYVFIDGEKEGPYTKAEVATMLEDDVLGFKDYCVREGSTKRQRLDALFEVVPDEDGEEDGDPVEIDEAEAAEAEVDGGEEEEWEYEDEVATVEEEEGDGETDGGPGRVIYSGHPSLLTYKIAWIVALVGAVGGYLLAPAERGGIWFFIIGSLIAVFAVIYIVIDRSTRHYLVTPRRVEAIWGLIAKSSNEVLVNNIRSINVRKSGVLGLIGIGTVEFSSAGDSIDVSFRSVWAAQRVKLLVRGLQDAAAMRGDGDEEDDES